MIKSSLQPMCRYLIDFNKLWLRNDLIRKRNKYRFMKL